MSSRSGFRRNWRSWRPTSRQRQVLDLLVDGKTNAQIAEALGLSLETARWHVGELLGETGLSDRRALAAWWTEERSREARPAAFLGLFSPRGVLVPGGAIGAAIFVAFLVLMLLDGSGLDERDDIAGLDLGPESRPEALVETQGPPDSCEPPEQSDLRLVTRDEMIAAGLTPAGRLITPLHCPIYAANRIDRAYGWLAGEGVIELDAVPGWQLEHTSDLGISFKSGLPSLTPRLLEIIAVGPGSAASPGAIVVDEASSIAVTQRVHGEGAYLLVTLQDQGLRRVALTSTGELFIDEGTLPLNVAVNEETGEQIDLSGMRLLGRLAVDGRPSTECKGSTCVARLLLRDAVVGAPLDGTLRCLDPVSPVPGTRLFEFETTEFTLTFRSIDPNAVGPPRAGTPGPAPVSPSEIWTCEEREVVAGEPLPLHEDVAIVDIGARSEPGRPESVVITYDGTLYVGHVELEHRCALLQFC